MPARFGLFVIPSLLSSAIVLTSCGGSGGSATPLAITVSLSKTSATVPAGMTAQFAATVSNDMASQGVTWNVSCSAAPCGSVSPATTPTGAMTTYSAPVPAGNLTVILTAQSLTDPTKTASAAITVAGVTVSVSPSSASLPFRGAQQFTATVDNDPSNAGVTWSLYFELPGHGPQACGSACGSLSPVRTASGQSTVYTAPTGVNSPIPNELILSASAVNTGAIGQAGITLLYVSISIAPLSPDVRINTTQQFTASVANDVTNSGVTWLLSQNGVACSPTCGTITPSTSSGSPAVYSSPATLPALPVLTVTATSVEDPTQYAIATVTLVPSSGESCPVGTGNESLLHGQYAFLLHGLDSNGAIAMVGSFTADGTGKVTGGREDGPGSEIQVPITATGSAYAVGPDGRGCLIISNTNGETTLFRFALGSVNSSNIAMSGRIIEFYDTPGTGVRGSGTIRLQDPTSFTPSEFRGNYTFGLVGGGGGRYAIVGTLISDGISAITSAAFDINSSGTVTNAPSAAGGRLMCCGADGDGTFEIRSSSSNVEPFSYLTFYMVNGAEIYVMGRDSTGEAIGGEAFATPLNFAFSQDSLNGPSVFHQTGQPSDGSIVDIGIANANGTDITLNHNINSSGLLTTSSNTFNYSVDPNGRVSLSGSANPPVLYLFGQNQGFLLGTDPTVFFGTIEPQTGGPFSDSSLSGAYILGTENPCLASQLLESGTVSPTGTASASGTVDQSSSTALLQNQVLEAPYSISPDGRGAFGTDTTAILISGNKFVFISNTSPDPTIIVVEK